MAVRLGGGDGLLFAMLVHGGCAPPPCRGGRAALVCAGTFGEPKYGPGYTTEWVNPHAPKGGTLRLKNPTGARASTSST